MEWDDEQEQEALEKVERNSQVLMSEEKRGNNSSLSTEFAEYACSVQCCKPTN